MAEPKVGLVACSKSKASGPRRACELYASPLFRKAADYCRRRYDAWFVLSALHGLLEPDRVIEPYERTLVGLTKAQKREWAAGVAAQIEGRGLRGARFYLHAGRAYAAALSGLLDCQTPLAGLGIGQQLAWYPEAAAADASGATPTTKETPNEDRP
jgi:hypothetical protein